MNKHNYEIIPALYIVSTPIGNLNDTSLRSKLILSNSDYVLCEDTRVSSKLLNSLGIKKKLISFHEYNEVKKIKSLIKDLKEKKILSLISDAGTPALSDPGRLLVSQCYEEGIKVIPVPGPSAITSALSVSGFSDNFYFSGFLPKKDKEIKERLNNLKFIKGSLVFFMPARDLKKNAKYFLDYFSNSPFFIAREMTKIHETYVRDKMENIFEHIPNNEKGEMTFIIDNSSLIKEKQSVNVDIEIKQLVGKMSSKDIADYLSKKLDISKKLIYQRVIKLNE